MKASPNLMLINLPAQAHPSSQIVLCGKNVVTLIMVLLIFVSESVIAHTRYGGSLIKIQHKQRLSSSSFFTFMYLDNQIAAK